MRIGVDLDYTISALPQWFAILCEAFVTAGHEVHVITYRPPGTDSEVRVELEELGIRYTALHLPEVAGVQPPEWKAEVAERLQLDLMIEDSPEVLARMPARTARLWLCDGEVFDLDVCIRALRERAP